MKLDKIEEEQEQNVQNRVIEIGEEYSQELKKAWRTSEIDQVLMRAFELIDALKGQQNMRRFVKSNLESIGSLRKEVILQGALINSLEANGSK